MRFKKVKTIGGFSYQCYFTPYDSKEIRIARIDEPHLERHKEFAERWSVNFVGGYANGEVRQLLKITNKIKKLSKEYRDK